MLSLSDILQPIYKDTDKPILDVLEHKNLGAFKTTEMHFHNEEAAARTTSGASLHTRNQYFHRSFRAPLVALGKHARILEVAAGTRGDTLELAQAGQPCVLTDISKTSLEKSYAIARDAGLLANTRFVVCDGEALPFRDASFDGILIAAAFHHFPNQKAALAELARVLKPGGVLVFGVEPASWPYYTWFFLARPLKWFMRRARGTTVSSVADDETHGYTKRSLHKLFAGSPLRLEKTERVVFLLEYYHTISRALRGQKKQYNKTIEAILEPIDYVLAHIPILNWLCWHWNVVARKKSV